MKEAEFDNQYDANYFLLLDKANERENGFSQYNRKADVESTDEEFNSPCPIFDTFHEEGVGEEIRSMTNFDPTNFETRWNILYEHVSGV